MELKRAFAADGFTGRHSLLRSFSIPWYAYRDAYTIKMEIIDPIYRVSPSQDPDNWI
jgi:hypothetical protein